MSDSTGTSTLTVRPETQSYFQRLNDYFPEQELKHPHQLQALVQEQSVYHKLESEDYLLLYSEYPDFMFVDYLLVDAKTRGNGVGSRVMKRLQQRDKAIVLEVEPENPKEPDTILRRKFYGRHGFQLARGVRYRRKDDDGVPFEMDILCWSPREQASDVDVLDMMAEVCETVHNFQAEKFIGRVPADPNAVLSLTIS